MALESTLSSLQTRHYRALAPTLQVSPYGSTDFLPFAAMGSGSVVAMAVLEQEYRDNMSRDTAVDLITRAIMSGVYNDLGSGSNVDICVVGPGGAAEMLRNHKVLQGRLY